MAEAGSDELKKKDNVLVVRSMRPFQAALMAGPAFQMIRMATMANASEDQMTSLMSCGRMAPFSAPSSAARMKMFDMVCSCLLSSPSRRG